jgi:hypothetical protein
MAISFFLTNYISMIIAIGNLKEKIQVPVQISCSHDFHRVPSQTPELKE